MLPVLVLVGCGNRVVPVDLGGRFAGKNASFGGGGREMFFSFLRNPLNLHYSGQSVNVASVSACWLWQSFGTSKYTAWLKN